MSQYENIIVERRDSVLWLRINRVSSRNALSRGTLAELCTACMSNASESDLKAAVLIGEGTKAFAAGGDLKELSNVRTAAEATDLFNLASKTLDAVRRFPVPIVAALNGVAVGGGAELALACDFRVAAAHASIGFIQARLNISCGFGGGAELARLLGYSRALLHELNAQALDPFQAKSLGLVDEVASNGESLEQCVARFLEPILVQKSQVIRAYKAIALADRLGLSMEERRIVERDGFVRTWMHPDHWTAVDLMMENKSQRRGT